MSPLSDGLNRIPVAQLYGAPEFPGLVEEYARESALAEMPPVNPTLASYKRLENAGVLIVFAWVKHQQIVGFLKLMVSVVPHYSIAMGIVESIFIAAAHREGGAGLSLLTAAEDHARACGCPALLVSTPAGSRLEKILPRRGYRASNRVFIKRVAND